MVRGILLLIAVGVNIYALVDCWRSTPEEIRGLPKRSWLILMAVLFPLALVVYIPLGGLAYLVFGRRSVPGDPTSRPGPRVIAPDDDPDFLRSLEQKRRAEAAEERRQRREAEKQARKEKRPDREADGQ